MAAFTKAVARGAIAVAGVMMLVLGSASTASAATPRNGVCEAGEICFYYLSNLGGSVSDFTGSVANYGTSQPTCYEFRGSGAGNGDCIKNNARSAWNRSGRNVRVYFNSNYGGASDLVPAGTWRNLDVTYDENASHKFL